MDINIHVLLLHRSVCDREASCMPFERITKSYTCHSYRDTVSDILTHSQFTKSGPIICLIYKLHVLCCQNNTSSSKPQVGPSTKSYDLRGPVCKLFGSYYNTCSVFQLVKLGNARTTSSVALLLT